MPRWKRGWFVRPSTARAVLLPVLVLNLPVPVLTTFISSRFHENAVRLGFALSSCFCRQVLTAVNASRQNKAVWYQNVTQIAKNYLLPKQLGSYPRKYTMSKVILFTFHTSQFAADWGKKIILCQKVVFPIMGSCNKLQAYHCFYPSLNCSCFWRWLIMRLQHLHWARLVLALATQVAWDTPWLNLAMWILLTSLCFHLKLKHEESYEIFQTLFISYQCSNLWYFVRWWGES